MKRLAILVFLSLITALARGGTFELSDPATEIYKEIDEEKQAAAEKALAPQSADSAAPQAAPSQEATQSRPAGGMGKTSCRDLVSYKQPESRWYEVRLSWAQGYVNAATEMARSGNAAAAATNPEPEAVEGWLDFYCREHPDDDLAHASDAFVKFRSSSE